MTIDPKMTVAEIARRHPETMKVFAKHKIDLCCGGIHPLETVARKHGLDLDAILREIDAAAAANR